MGFSLTDGARHLNLARARDQAPAHLSLPAVILMTDARRTPDPVADVRRLPPDAAVIFRHYELTPPSRLALARILRAATLARGVKLLIADDMALALAVRADGLHLSERRLRGPVAHLRRRPGWLVTAAAHSAPALRRAADAGVSAALLSPVFPTLSHPGAPSLGPLRFAALVRASGQPVYALGGVHAGNVRRLRGCGAAGIAAIGGLTRATPQLSLSVEDIARADFQSFA